MHKDNYNTCGTTCTATPSHQRVQPTHTATSDPYDHTKSLESAIYHTATSDPYGHTKSLESAIYPHTATSDLYDHTKSLESAIYHTQPKVTYMTTASH